MTKDLSRWLLSVTLLILPWSADAACPKIPRSLTVLRQFQRLHPCPATGKTTGPCPGWIKDHVIPRCLGGPDTVANLQWQTLAESRAKDTIERQQCQVAPGHCAHQGD